MFCQECGKQLEDGVKFCSNCGNKIENNNIEQTKNESIEDTAANEAKIQRTTGNIQKIIEAIIVRKGKGDPLLIINIRKKLVFKGINPAKYTCETVDDPEVLKKLIELAKDLGFKL